MREGSQVSSSGSCGLLDGQEERVLTDSEKPSWVYGATNPQMQMTGRGQVRREF